MMWSVQEMLFHRSLSLTDSYVTHTGGLDFADIFPVTHVKESLKDRTFLGSEMCDLLVEERRRRDSGTVWSAVCGEHRSPCRPERQDGAQLWRPVGDLTH